MAFVYDDGGRAESGRQGEARDCVARAIAIAAELPYAVVYAELAKRMQCAGYKRSARNGIFRKVYERYLNELGFDWHACMGIGTGCQVHLRAEELPAGRIVCRLSKHLCAVTDGVMHDTNDPSRDGTRCVYGYWSRP